MNPHVPKSKNLSQKITLHRQGRYYKEGEYVNFYKNEFPLFLSLHTPFITSIPRILLIREHLNLNIFFKLLTVLNETLIFNFLNSFFITLGSTNDIREFLLH